MYKSVVKTVMAGVIAVSAATAIQTPAFAGDREAVKRSAPEYPRAAERRGIEGYVVLEYTVLADGGVDAATVVEAEPAGIFDKAALKALSKWKYKAAAADTPGQQVKLTFKN